jgi:hypothetical protein
VPPDGRLGRPLAKRSAERGEGRSPNGVEEGGRGAEPPRVQGGALARP